MKTKITYLLVSLIVIWGSDGAAAQATRYDRSSADTCRLVAKGIEYCQFDVRRELETTGGRIHVLRIDPSLAKLKLMLASEHRNVSRTAAEWCREFGLVAAINAGMYGEDYLTNVGYLRNGPHVQNRRWKKSYKSALAFDPQRPDRPPAVMLDLDDPDSMKQVQDYNVIIQNLRLMKGEGINVWGKSERKWSEAAVGMDKSGRILFLFCRWPYPMLEFNEIVKSLGLSVVRLMHVDGGPVASMSIRTGNLSLDISGSYETGLSGDDTNDMQWPIPNVIGVQAR